MSLYQHRSTLRVLEVLEKLSNSENGYTLTELTKILEIPKSSLYPIIQTLNREGYLSLNEETLKFTLGAKVLILSASYLNKNTVLNILKNEMQKLVNKFSETCQLAVLKDGEVLYLARIDSLEPIRLVSSEGKRLPAYCTSLGKALLSNHSFINLKELYPNGLKKMTPKTIDNIEDLYNEILEIRKTSIAYEKEEVTEHIQCYSVPIMKKDEVYMAVSVTIPTFRASLKEEEIKKGLLEFKRKIEKIVINFENIQF
jgi:DNA-binding IclR family transcriptional regulator